MTKIYLDAKHFSLTYWTILSPNDLLEGFRDRLKQLNKKLVEYVISTEIGPESGEPHCHAYFVLDTKIRGQVEATIFDVHGSHPNIQKTKRENNWTKYVVKGGNYITNIQGKVDRSLKEPAKTKDEIGKDLIEGTKSLAQLTKENPRLIFDYSRLRQSMQLYRLDTNIPERLAGPCGVWIAGPPGVGKSLLVYKRWPDHYSKNNSKWWDGYQSQDLVCCHDVDFGWKEAATHFKIWADAYPFNCETKNGTINIRPKHLYVTSNYTIDEWLKSCGIRDDSLLAAIHRRFRSYWITSEEDWEEQL